VTEQKKKELYFSGAPVQTDASKPLPGEMSPERRRAFMVTAGVAGAFALGIVIGLALAPGTPAELTAKNAALEEELSDARDRVQDLERTLRYRETDKPVDQGKLKPEIRAKNEQGALRIAAVMKKYKAQGASELMEWFIKRWDELLDSPQADDRVARRAATLALLVGGMAENMHPQDFVEWQAAFFKGNWLAELHYDIDGDGLPGKSSTKNPKDGFANVSVCHIAMALNQAVTDTQILMTPDMRCDRPQSRMSLFLQGSTFADAIDEFVDAVKKEGFLVVERRENGMHLILVGSATGR
jgi:hypothetical protein